MSFINPNTLSYADAHLLAQKLVWDLHNSARLLSSHPIAIGVCQHLRPTRSRLVRNGRGLAAEPLMTSAEHFWNIVP